MGVGPKSTISYVIMALTIWIPRDEWNYTKVMIDTVSSRMPCTLP